MKANFRTIAVGLIAAFVLLSGCGSGDIPEPTPTILPTSTHTPILVPTLTPTLTSTATPVPTQTPLGGASDGVIVYKDLGDSGILWPHYPPMSGSERSEVSLANPDGSQKRLFFFPVIESKIPEDRKDTPYLYFSPDGMHVLIEFVNYGTQINSYLYNINTGSVTQIKQIPNALNVFWEWSPDSSMLAGRVDFLFGKREGYLINNDGTGLTKIAESDMGDGWVWSPNSKRIYFIGRLEKFWTMNVEDSDKYSIDLDGFDQTTYIHCMQFSPDNKKVIFMIEKSYGDGFYKIYTGNSDFSDVTLVTEFETEISHCSKFELSPDQKYLMVVLDNQCVHGTCFTGYDGYVFRMDTGEAVSLPSDILLCGWSPDSYLTFLRGTYSFTVDGLRYYDYKNSLQLLYLSKPDMKPVKTSFDNCPIAWLPAAN